MESSSNEHNNIINVQGVDHFTREHECHTRLPIDDNRNLQKKTMKVHITTHGRLSPYHHARKVEQ